MLSKTFRAGRLALGGAVLAALASCGGSGSDDGGVVAPVAVSPTASIPPSASASTLGFIAFLKLLVVTQPDDAQPLDTTGFIAPMDDTGPYDPSI